MNPLAPASSPIPTPASVSITDHGLLTGLADDDHTQYHNDARALTWLGTRSTSDLSEGYNLYFTNERVDDRVAALLAAGTGITLTYNDAGNVLTVATAFTLGGSSTAANPATLATVAGGSSSTSGTGETDLKSYTLPASTGGAGRALRITAWGTCVVGHAITTLKLYYGGTVIATATLTGDGSASVWRLQADIIWTGANAQSYTVEVHASPASGGIPLDMEQGTLTKTDSSTQVIKCTGQCSAGSMTQNGLIVEVLN